MIGSAPLRIRPSGPLAGTVVLPGDKSISHRALLISAIADGISRIENFLIAGVTQAMMDCLEELGVYLEVDRSRSETLSAADLAVHGRGLRGLDAPKRHLDCRGSATTMRLMAGVLAGQEFQSTLDGNERLRLRPMDRVVDPLRAKGARIESHNGNAPLTFVPSELRASEHHLAVASAQVKSALLLAGLFSEAPTTVSEPSASRDHTERMLRKLGVSVEEWHDQEGRHWVKMADPVDTLPRMDVRLPSDPSSAAFLGVAATLVPDSHIRLPGVCVNPGRLGLFSALAEMGGRIEMTPHQSDTAEPSADLAVYSQSLHGVTVGGSSVPRMIDEFPILAVAATQARGATLVKDAAELRLKESDRIDTLCGELRKMGADIEPAEDGFVVRGPARLQGTAVDARGDHRLAMSLTVAGLVADGETVVHGWEVMQDSFPEFPQVLKQLGADVRW